MATLEKRGDFWRVKIRRTKAIRFNPAHSIPKPATLQSSTDVVVVDLLCAIQVGGHATLARLRDPCHNGSVGKKMGVRPS